MLQISCQPTAALVWWGKAAGSPKIQTLNTLELGVGVGLTLRSSGLELTGFEQKLDFGAGGCIGLWWDGPQGGWLSTGAWLGLSMPVGLIQPGLCVPPCRDPGHRALLLPAEPHVLQELHQVLGWVLWWPAPHSLR